MAAIRASRSTPRGVLARLKQAMVGTSPWLNAPNVGPESLMAASSRGLGHREGAGRRLSRAKHHHPVTRRSPFSTRVRPRSRALWPQRVEEGRRVAYVH